jgi:glycosyltransferase involved in cell wall biosynthesis
MDVLADADADIYVQVGSDAWTGYVSEFAHTMRRPFIFVASHIDDCDLTAGGRPKFWEAYDKHTRQQYLQGLRRSDAIVVLANYMKDALPAEFRAKCHVIPFGDEPPQDDILQKKRGPPFVLWASGMRKYKRPFEVLDVASQLPEVEFVVCGIGPMYQAFKAKAAKFSNIKVRGAILSFMEMEELFARAALTLNTSDSEGFPDTFTRSWMNAAPVVTVRVDPDELICRERLGYHSGTCDQAARDIAKLVNNSTLRTQMGERCRTYAIKHLHIEATVDSNLRLYEQLLGTRKN